MPSAPLLLSQAFNGLALGTLLALVSSGLTIILGTLATLYVSAPLYAWLRHGEAALKAQAAKVHERRGRSEAVAEGV